MDRDVAAAVERLEAGDPIQAALDPLAAIARRDSDAPERLMEALVKALEHPNPGVACTLATFAGALVEDGVNARPLALAVVSPMRRAIEQAAPFVEQALLLQESEDGAYVAGEMVDQGQLDALTEAQPLGAAAFASLDRWHLPVAAAWTRDTATLRELQRDHMLRATIDGLSKVGGIHWIASLLRVPFAAPLIVVFPELSEAWTLTMSGIADNGQLTVLLSSALQDPVRRVGATTAPDGMLACMAGEGPQQISDGYHCDLHLYPWEALDLATGLPKPGLFTWVAPGGFGDHSLPQDFWPGDLEPVADDVRMLFAVGLNAVDGIRITRIISGSRAFAALPARLENVRRLPRPATEKCIAAARLRVESRRHLTRVNPS